MEADVISVTERFEPEFIRTHLGASQVPAAIGLDPHCPPILLWQRYMGLEPWPERTPAMDWGHRLEGIVGDHAAARLGVEIEKGETIIHPRISWLVATPDFRIKQARRNIQAKTVGAVTFAHGVKQRWGDGGDEAPLYSIAQVMTEMIVDRANDIPTEATYIAAWLAGEEPRLFDIPYDEEAARGIVSKAAAFWRCVETKEPPPPDGSDAFHEYLARKYPASMDGKTIEADEHATAVAYAYVRAKEEAKAAETAAKFARNSLESMMRDAERLKVGSGSISYKSQENNPALQDTFWTDVARLAGMALTGTPAYNEQLRPDIDAEMITVGRAMIDRLKVQHTARVGTHRVMRIHNLKEKK